MILSVAAAITVAIGATVPARLDLAILVLLVVVALVVAWTAATIYAVHRDIAPLVNSPLARTLSGAGT